MRRFGAVVAVAVVAAVGIAMTIRAFSRETSSPATRPDKAVAVRLPQPSPAPVAALDILGAPRSGDMVLIGPGGMKAVSPSGSVRRLLGDDLFGPVDLAPDGIHLALMKPIFPGTGPGDVADTGIYVVDLSTGDQRYLTPCPSTCRGTLDWSPDGTRIAFSDAGGFSVPDGHVYVIDADGTELTRLPAGPFAYGPSWSPDGTRIAFLLGKSSAWFEPEPGAQEVFSIQVDGSNQLQLASCTRGCKGETVAWSPDGSWIAYSDRNGISEVSPDGSRMTYLGRVSSRRTYAAGGPLYELVWSPDGTQIALPGASLLNVDTGKVAEVAWPCPCRREPGWGRIDDVYWIRWVP